MKKLPFKPRRGDVIEIDWLDIYEDATGDPRKAQPARRQTVARFFGWRPGILVTTNTVETTTAPGQEGYCAYPRGCVTGIRLIETTPVVDLMAALKESLKKKTEPAA